MDKKLEQKFREAFESTIENVDLRYDGSLKNIDYLGLYFKATAQEKMYKFLGLDTYMFNYVHNDCDSILIIFSIPNGEDSSTKYVADKVMDIVELCERVLITTDYIKSKELKDDKFIYVSVIKKLNNGN